MAAGRLLTWYGGWATADFMLTWYRQLGGYMT
jgi:hypothetical protein